MSRNIAAGTCTGWEGVRIVLLEVFMKDTGVRDRLEDIAEKIAGDGGGFKDFHDLSVGGAILDEDNTLDKFYAWLAHNPKLNLVADYEYVSMWGNRTWSFNYLAMDLGQRLKQTKWWEKNTKKLEKYKKDLKVVKKIMNS